MIDAAQHPPLLEAPASWRAVDFISDLHLQAAEPATVAAWKRYMAQSPANAIFILGDLFEVWVGDDAAQPGSFEHECAQVLQEAAHTRELFFMHGNRDFLLGDTMAAAGGFALLQDPTVLLFAGQRWLLTHGDALCLDDHDYMAFRAQVRNDAWRNQFLAQPLQQRQAVGRELRAQSEARKRSGATYADVDAGEARRWLSAANASTLIHGHTHKPAEHPLGQGMRRVVLSDWEADAKPQRLEVMRLSADGLQRIALGSLSPEA
ncbi:UDP-2,3-diacylglucosamine diphosphatase [Variovorax sp. VNK109]|uniref:UDP-2,3-diacylglucosamine diphosphatase n=1 Tax=Variovorax sp. VNK109 TaxID=3400919 RepID=UPI003BFCBFEF